MTVWLLLALIAFAVLSFYLGFVRRDPLFAWRSQAAFVVLVFLLIPVVAVALYQEGRALRTLERYLPAYPERSDVMAVPLVDSDVLLMLTTAAGRDEVIAWYRNPEHRPNWAIESESELGLYLVRGDERLAIEVTENAAGSRRTIFYRLRDSAERVP